MGMAQDENRVTSFDYFSQLSRTHQKVVELLVKSTRSFQQSLLKNLKVAKPRSYRGKVIFSPRAVIDILLDSLMFHLNGRVVLEKSSRWNLDHLGSLQLSSLITLQDSAWLSDRFSCGLFDREGTPTTELELFSKGILNHFLLDHYSAKALHQSSNGHASGGPSGAPSVDAHSLSLKAGNCSLTKLVNDADPQSEGILWINRYSGQTDPVSGDFSGVAKGSEWWVGGSFQHCVEETLISGNIFECLNQNLLGLSSETKVVDSSHQSPYLLIDGVSVTAG
jgi:PmbA protein